MGEQEIGKITHFFGKISVGIIKMSADLKVGDKVSFKGHTTGFEQVINSMQINHQEVQEAKSGDEVGIKLNEHVRVGDVVFLVTE
ncbi:hypothetical protein GOV05_05490 [Candidatus Woesearchaeota archaeon]|nr:hypothetical protein [Candidatus Woesearchaeota archaeon]